jgi:DNA-directed RNA polymerase subunit RPC12/RpoP
MDIECPNCGPVQTGSYEEMRTCSNCGSVTYTCPECGEEFTPVEDQED